MDEWLKQQVWQRARNSCEYCRMPQALYPARFQIDHIIARKHRGTTDFDNLALSCLRCNSHKGTNISGIDPETGAMVRLFHPRWDLWEEHFEWNGPRLKGCTPVGRTTVDVLTINHTEATRLRESLIEEGLFPP